MSDVRPSRECKALQQKVARGIFGMLGKRF
jgi:hypothetical protein